jgi:flagellar basal-body rod protein FlgG
MDVGAHIAASGAIANEKILEHVTHNLANASTPGFKKRLMQLETVPFSLPRNEWAGSDSMAFVQMKPPVIHKEQGFVEQTGRDLDLAIEGKGHFQVSTPQGVRSVRNGRLRLTPDGTIVTKEGHPVLDDQGNKIQVDNRERMEISENGEIREGERRIGRLMIVDEKGRPVKEEDYRVAQAHLERSNVNSFEEMVTIIEQTRNHGSYLKLIKGFDELEGKTIQEMGRV